MLIMYLSGSQKESTERSCPQSDGTIRCKQNSHFAEVLILGFPAYDPLLKNFAIFGRGGRNNEIGEQIYCATPDVTARVGKVKRKNVDDGLF